MKRMKRKYLISLAVMLLFMGGCGRLLSSGSSTKSIDTIGGYQKGNISVYKEYDANNVLTFSSTNNILDDHYSDSTYGVSDVIKLEWIGQSSSASTTSKYHDFYKLNSAGFYFSGSMDANSSGYIYDPANKNIVLPLVEGYIASYNIQTKKSVYANGKVSYTANYTETVKYVVDSFVDVTVPAGTFNCAKIIFTGSSYVKFFYIAKEGLIKSEVFDASSNALLNYMVLYSKNW